MVMDAKKIRAVIDCEEFEARGEVIWSFELLDDNGQITITAEASGEVAGEEVCDRKVIDVRYIKKEEGWFEEFCLEMVKGLYGVNGKKVEMV